MLTVLETRNLVTTTITIHCQIIQSLQSGYTSSPLPLWHHPIRVIKTTTTTHNPHFTIHSLLVDES